MMNRLKLLTFDVTNTILKVKDSPGHHYTSVAKHFGINMSPSDLDNVYDSMIQKKKQDHPNYGRDHGMTTKEWWQDLICRVFVTAGYKGKLSTLRCVSNELWDRFEEGTDWEVIPHSHETLSALRNAGITLGVVSNFDESLKKTLAVNKLDHYFDFLVTAVSAGTEKPDPAIFHHALSMSGMSPSESGHVGDDISHDYHTPKSIGMSAFLFNRESTLPQSSLASIDRKDVISDLLDLNRLVVQQ